MRNTLKTLTTTYGGAGRENTVAEVIREMVAPYVDTIETDALGNLICIKKGEGKRVMLAAHMDHIGFIVTNIDENGFLRVHNCGGIRPANSMNRHVVFENGVHGLLSNEMKDFDNTLAKMFIDIGAHSKEEAESMVSLGDVAVYAPDVFDMGDYLSGPAMDNRVGCAVVVETLKQLCENPKSEVAAVFTVQEEVGCRGARAAAYSVNPDVGIALDVTMTGDTPNGFGIACGLGKGVAIKLMDSSLICTPSVVKALIGAAERESIPFQREVLTAGGTDASAMNTTRGGIPSGVLSIACRYVHSATETVSVSDCEAAAKLLATVLNNGEL
ncbi:MAG: M20/M25/M40 family metallo-hydrolase [Clostridia bacterium]|nr:M20/M25/M40 family metallo-hydrolase [Clostridia bacterium]